MHARHWVHAALPLALLAGASTLLLPPSAPAIGTSFTYQGQLLQNGTPVDGTCDLQFGVFLVPSGGAPISPGLLDKPDVAVDHGLFTVELDFGAIFDSLGDRYLEIASRCPAEAGSFTTLAPRQLITGAPYALGLVLPWIGTIASDQPAVFVTNNGSGTAATFLKPFDLNVTSPTVAASAGGFGSVAVSGESASGAGVRGSCAGTLFAGVEGHSTATSGGTGVLGKIEGSNGTAIKGVANDGDSSKAIYGQSLQGYSGYFDGRVQVISPSSDEPDAFVLSVEFDHVARIDATGKGFFNGGTQNSGADVAEFIPTADQVEPGDVVEIDPARPNHFRLAAAANSTAVAGVISTDPGVSLNAKGSARAAVSGPQLALVGRVPVKVTAENGPIRPGDLLVTSSTPGRAMRGPKNPAAGTVIGKALTPFDDGVGVTEMLVMLR